MTSKLVQTMRAGGTVASIRHALRRTRERRKYAQWIEANRITAQVRNELVTRIANLPRQPKISIVLPVYNVEDRWLRLCIDSVIDQIYPTWQLCIADDASTEPHIAKVLQEYESRDDRIKVTTRTTNGHISAASNSALEMVDGDFVVLLDHDDELAADALFWLVNELHDFPDAVVIYSDEDLIDEHGMRSEPKFKPDFSRDLFYSFNLLTHLSAFKIEAVREAGGFRVGFEGSQDYDLSLRILEMVREEQIRHIPRVLYHWRVIRGSVAFSMDEKPYAHDRARRALAEHFQRTGVDAEVVASSDHLHRVRYRGFQEITSTLLSVRAGGTIDELNRAAADSDGEVLLFVDVDLIEPLENSYAELITFAMQPGIGAVGAKILSSSGAVEQCGIVMTPELTRALAHSGFPRDASGDMSRNRQIGNFSAISLSCLAIRRELFERVDGFDSSISREMCDVDLCLRLRKLGYRIVTLPHVELRRRGRYKRGTSSSKSDLEIFRQRWPEYIERDPFCNPNLKRDGSFDIKSALRP